MTKHSAAALYEMWHQKHPRNVIPKTYEFNPPRRDAPRANPGHEGPGVMTAVGRAAEILYSSDKWEKNGDFWPYEHDFDSRPTVYANWGEGRGVQTTSLLQVRDLNDEWEMPLLAFVKSITYDDADGERRRLVFGKKGPVMTCSPDKKTLVILASRKTGPIFVRGGKMVVTERGIVK
jgi:hypothetical protein